MTDHCRAKADDFTTSNYIFRQISKRDRPADAFWTAVGVRCGSLVAFQSVGPLEFVIVALCAMRLRRSARAAASEQNGCATGAANAFARFGCPSTHRGP